MLALEKLLGSGTGSDAADHGASGDSGGLTGPEIFRAWGEIKSGALTIINNNIYI